MIQNTESPKTKLPLIDVEAELRRFETEEKKRLGMDGDVDQWIETMANATFTKSEKEKITLLISGLTLAHDYLIEGALKGVGYNVQMLDQPDNAAFQAGKEYGNRGQCNPTYFTVGNLVKFLCTLRDKHGMTSEEIVSRYVFLTAGACGPCRFGMYVTEFRKALRDAGFDGFRVMLFQQTGGLKQATGEESGLEMNPTFFLALVRAIMAGDVINALGYRLRPYEVNPGDTDRAIETCKRAAYQALERRESVLLSLLRSKELFRSVEVDRSIAKPRVSIIGEFWAMTTEGDGNYHLQRFLESEGAEVDIQLVTAWLLYMLWESRRDTKERMGLAQEDSSKYGLAGLGAFGATKRLATVQAADWIVRALFQTFAHAVGLYGYHLPDMDEIARISHDYYDNELRGGEGHMEVGKLIMNVTQAKAHMTLSVKPFGCMPSAGVSDGVQSAITELYPGTIFCPVETSGDGKVNFYSRVQMYLFKARQAAQTELERAFAEAKTPREEIMRYLAEDKGARSPLSKAPHRYAGTAADRVAWADSRVGTTALERAGKQALGVAKRALGVLRASPKVAVRIAQKAESEAPAVIRLIREDIKALRDERSRSRHADASLQAAE